MERSSSIWRSWSRSEAAMISALLRWGGGTWRRAPSEVRKESRGATRGRQGERTRSATRTAAGGDVLELRLSPAAARAVLPRGAGATRARAVGRLGVSAIDALAGSLDLVAFEPEFRGETPPVGAGDPDLTAFELVHLGRGADLATAVERLRGLAEVLSADPIALLPVSALPNDSLAFATYWLFKDQPVRTDIRAPEAWQISSGDTSIVVGIIDTGVVPYHPDLGGRARQRRPTCGHLGPGRG